jgi:hypothetical protein
MSKEDLKKSRKNIEPYSSQNLPSNDPFTKTADKFYHGSTGQDFNLNFALSK